jgi:predicted unusual protein kinase regulating ubiquinone biosynthesis (AarF/ABC1/UbiB family)
VLIEEFVEGNTIAFYESHSHTLNKVIASLGAKAFFSMLMQHNFIHADCHAGNIIVRIKSSPNKLTNMLVGYFQRTRAYLIATIIKYGFDSPFLRKLSEEHYAYEKNNAELLEKYK